MGFLAIEIEEMMKDLFLFACFKMNINAFERIMFN